ncbi:MAG: M14 family metallocarboxypeptidase [Idiomarina sp.]|nr:M14 family metallocarboxypeptidase [Idiomarina sp.]
MQRQYPIGTPGKPWQAEEKQAWLAEQKRQRSYQDDVVAVLEGLDDELTVTQYGELAYTSEAGQSYPLFAVSVSTADAEKPYVLITGGVHGYETSGVHGALKFIQDHFQHYSKDFNIIVVPCVSPWGYETINRWNVHAVDPNRSFKAASLQADSQAGEAAALMRFVEESGIDFLAHIDLHETTDSDNSEFRPALAARDGVTNDNWNIPDGFYLVADSERPQTEFQAAIIKAVSAVTHIAPADENGQLIGADLTQSGVIEYPGQSLGLCMGLTQAQFVTTTEVYPDSDKATPALCVDAQVAAITGGLDFLR